MGLTFDLASGDGNSRSKKGGTTTPTSSGGFCARGFCIDGPTSFAQQATDVVYGRTKAEAARGRRQGCRVV